MRSQPRQAIKQRVVFYHLSNQKFTSTTLLTIRPLQNLKKKDRDKAAPSDRASENLNVMS
jgi:hypothetical protein